MLSPHLAKFGGYGYCSSGDIMVLVCHVILQDYVANGSGNFTGRSASREATILPGLVAIGTVVVEI